MGAGAAEDRAAGCGRCAGALVPGHHYCEACGRDLRVRLWRSSTAAPGACVSCGGTDRGVEGYCDNCGRRRGFGQDHVELELAGVAAVTDRGRRKQRNEDAVAIGRLGPLVVGVVSDGVSSSARADEAAHTSVDAAVAALLAELAAGAAAEQATRTAVRAAAVAVASLVSPETAHSPPSCTYVSAVVSASEVVVGWVGDSRAYWWAEQEAQTRVLTTDDSLAACLAAEGRPAGPRERAAGRMDALARWLGADAADTAPRVITVRPTGPGRLLLCSDGLSRYLPDAAALAGVDSAAGPTETVRVLNRRALDAGGVDNIAIVIVPFPPAPAGSAPDGSPAGGPPA